MLRVRTAAEAAGVKMIEATDELADLEADEYAAKMDELDQKMDAEEREARRKKREERRLKRAMRREQRKLVKGHVLDTVAPGVMREHRTKSPPKLERGLLREARCARVLYA